jgi:hypothetical protein
MNERAILIQRVTTLSGLLDTPGGPLGPKAGGLSQQLQAGWEAERRLIQRIIEETPADAPDAEIEATLDIWRDRTAAFIKSSDSDRPTWTDRQGTVWDAQSVLAILEDIRERIEAWQDPGEADLNMSDEDETDEDAADDDAAEYAAVP